MKQRVAGAWVGPTTAPWAPLATLEADYQTEAEADAAYAPLTSPGLQLLNETTLGSDQANIEFGSIPATYRDLVIIGRGRSARAGNATDALQMRVGNGSVDSGSNYRYGQIINGTNATNSQSAGATLLTLGDTGLPGATADANAFSTFDVQILDYTTATRRREVVVRTIAHVSSTVYNVHQIEGAWLNTSQAINIVRLFPASANFVAGTRIALYGRR